MATGPTYPTSGLYFLTVPTPNGLKVSLALQELKAAGVPVKWEEYAINMRQNEQKEPWFLQINPNGRIPAIIDQDRNGVKVWETGSILLYLAKHYDTDYKLHFKDDDEETEMLNWIFFQHGGLGPMQGQAGHFLNAAPEKIQYGAKRYIDETKRLFGVYEERLKDRDYLAGPGKGKFSYADIVSVTWARAAPFSLGVVDVADIGFPLLSAWIKRIEAREAAKIAFEGDMINTLRAKPNWEEETKKKAEWVYKDAAKPKDEL